MASTGRLVGIAGIAVVAAVGAFLALRAPAGGSADGPDGSTTRIERGSRPSMAPSEGLPGRRVEGAPAVTAQPPSELRVPEALLDRVRAGAPAQVADGGVGEPVPLPPEAPRSRPETPELVTPEEAHQRSVDAWRGRTRAAASEAARAVDPDHEEPIVGIVADYVDEVTEARTALFAGDLDAEEYGRIVKDATVRAQRSIGDVVGSAADARAVWDAVREANAPR